MISLRLWWCWMTLSVSVQQWLHCFLSLSVSVTWVSVGGAHCFICSVKVDITSHALAPRSLYANREMQEKTFLTADELNIKFEIHLQASIVWITISYVCSKFYFCDNVSWSINFASMDTTWGLKPMGWTTLNVTILYNTTTQARQNNMGGQSRVARWSKNWRKGEWSGACGQHRRNPSGHFTHGHTHTHTNS